MHSNDIVRFFASTFYSWSSISNFAHGRAMRGSRRKAWQTRIPPVGVDSFTPGYLFASLDVYLLMRAVFKFSFSLLTSLSKVPCVQTSVCVRMYIRKSNKHFSKKSNKYFGCGYTYFFFILKHTIMSGGVFAWFLEDRVHPAMFASQILIDFISLMCSVFSGISHSQQKGVGARRI